MIAKTLTLLAVAAVAVAHAETITYPECPVNGSGCCAFGTGSMRNRGYVKLSLPEDIIVTCSRGALLCQSGNTGLHASETAIDGVDCPGTLASVLCQAAVLMFPLSLPTDRLYGSHDVFHCERRGRRIGCRGHSRACQRDR